MTNWPTLSRLDSHRWKRWQTATSNPALFLERSDIGAVKAGGVADLVLLSANPLDNIQNTKKITAVVINGRFLDRAALDHMLVNVEAAAKAQK